MNLHILPDTIHAAKFIEFLEKHFSMDDHYFLITARQNKLNYVQCDGTRQITILPIGGLSKIAKSMNNRRVRALFKICTSIYIHSLGFNNLIVLRYAKSKHKLTWLSWGYDVYEDISDNILENETTACLPTSKGIKKIVRPRKFITLIKRAVITKLDFIAMDYKEEFDLIKSNYKTNAVYKKFHYPSIINFNALDAAKLSNKYIPELSAFDRFHKLIQVGNSGSPNNNHIRVLYFIKSIQTEGNFGVVCPLSYGNPAYIDSVIKIGVELFGERFIPLTEFMNAETYFILLNKVDVALMNYYRQQGKGNILPLIYLGKKVFLREDTATFRAFHSMGIKIESIDALMRGEINDIFSPLTSQEIESNKCIISKKYSEEEELSKIRDLFQK